VLKKFSNALNQRRQEVLLRLNKIVFNILILIVLVGTVSSQLVSLLPFLALLGTGIAFAVRDALSSFLGWFLIGGENGYKAGQIVRLGNFYGRVHEVTPFLTLIKEIKGDHETGEIVTFPNKVIFEQPISHFSKYSGFVHKDLDFLMAEETDIDEAKKVLKSCIETHVNKERQSVPDDVQRLVRLYNLSDSDIAPLVWIENNDHGLALRARFLVKLSSAAYLKATIEEAFIHETQRSKKLNFHYIDSGRNQSNSFSQTSADRDSDHFH
jgi:small-conductance mechanosensitive channel